jgi:putative ABC transport system permease protein
MDHLRHDLRHACRALARRPAYTAAAALTLALGVGATTAIWSAVRGILLAPLPFAAPGRLTVVWEDLAREGNHRFSVAVPNYDDLKAQTTAFSGVAAQVGRAYTLTGGELPASLRGAAVTGDFFPLLGTRAALGRVLLPADERSAARVAVLSGRLFRQRFGGDPALLGQAIRLDGEPYTVVGVMPEGFSAPAFWKAPHLTAELWTPLVLSARMRSRGVAVLQVVARLRPGATVGKAQAEADALAARLARDFPATNGGVGLNVVPLADQLLGASRPLLLVLLGAASSLLLIAVANAAHLALARALARERELAVRAALGAGRGRLAGQVLAESLVLALLGGAVALPLAAWGTRVLVAAAPAEAVRLEEVRFDPAVFAFALAVSGLAGLAFGALPAARAARLDPGQALAGGSGGSGASGGTSGPGATFARDGLAVAQVALAVVLLVGGGLMASTLARLLAVDPGFKPDHLLSLRLALLPAKYPEPERQAAFFERLLARIEALPGVSSADFASRLPLDPAFGVGTLNVLGRAVPAGDRPVVGARVVSEGYFRTMGIPLLAGRSLAAADRDGAPLVALVNRTFARRFLADGNPVGRRISLGSSTEPWMEVAGVVGDVSHDGLGAEPIPEVYLPLRQNPDSGGAVVVRTTLAPAALAGAVRRSVLALDRDQPVAEVRTMDEALSASLSRPRFSALLLAAFAIAALLLAAVGLYGVLAYGVAGRVREIGIRMALGAEARDVVRLVAVRGLRLAALGLALGGLAALGLVRFLQSQLFGISATDPATFGGVAVLVVLVAGLATALPALRAAHLEPVTALRRE